MRASKGEQPFKKGESSLVKRMEWMLNVMDKVDQIMHLGHAVKEEMPFRSITQ